MSITERHFTLSVVCLIVECTKDSVRVTKKNIQIVVGQLGWKWIERSVLQLLLLNQKEVELLFIIITPHLYLFPYLPTPSCHSSPPAPRLPIHLHHRRLKITCSAAQTQKKTANSSRTVQQRQQYGAAAAAAIR